MSKLNKEMTFVYVFFDNAGLSTVGDVGTRHPKHSSFQYQNQQPIFLSQGFHLPTYPWMNKNHGQFWPNMFQQMWEMMGNQMGKQMGL